MKRSLPPWHLMLALALAATAQVDRATLTGTVKDSRARSSPAPRSPSTHIATNVAARTRSNNRGSFLSRQPAPGQYLVEAEAAGFEKTRTVGHPRDRPARRARLHARRRRRRESVTVRKAERLLEHRAVDPRRRSSTRTPSPSCPSRSATGTTCWRSCPACRATASPSRAAAPRSAAPAASTSTARARCRTTSCSTASTTTASPRTCRS